MEAIVIRGLSKKYPIYAKPVDRLKELLSRGRHFHQEFWALRDVDLVIPRGTTVGVIGHNGSGKSTLLQIVAGVLQPTSGEVIVNGRVSALLELGAGFNPEFTGRENVFLSGSVMGLSRREMEERFDLITAFAEIGDFIDQPVKTYSSGMFVRLAFAVAINVDPDILVVDEALSVGDAVFQHRCMRKIRELKDRGVTIFFVSHDSGAIKSLCTEALLLSHGRVVEHGDPESVVNRYHALVSAQISETSYEVGSEPRPVPEVDAEVPVESGFSDNPAFAREAGFFRHGTGEARICNVELISENGESVPVVNSGERVTLRAHLEFGVAATDVVMGFYIKDRLGVELVGTNTTEEAAVFPAMGPGDRVIVDFRFPAIFRPGHYSVTMAIAYNPRDPVYMDWVDNAIVFEIHPPRSGRTVHGLVDVGTSVRIAAVENGASSVGH